MSVEKKKKKKPEKDYFEKIILQIMEKSLKAALNEAIKDVLKDFK